MKSPYWANNPRWERMFYSKMLNGLEFSPNTIQNFQKKESTIILTISSLFNLMETQHKKDVFHLCSICWISSNYISVLIGCYLLNMYEYNIVQHKHKTLLKQQLKLILALCNFFFDTWVASPVIIRNSSMSDLKLLTLSIHVFIKLFW